MARELTTAEVLRAVGHPLRRRLLGIYFDSTASPSDIAAMIGEPIGNVSYHTRILARLGVVELVETKPVRGAIEHYYRAPAWLSVIVVRVPG